MTRRLASVARRAPETPPPSSQALRNVDDRLRKAVAALNRKDINYWEFRNATGRVEAHSYYQYPAMMVPSMQRVLLQTVLRLQSNIRKLVDPFAGSGTLIVEGISEGLNVTAYDVNPLAILLCRAKSELFDTDTLRENATRLLTTVAKDPGRQARSVIPKQTEVVLPISNHRVVTNSPWHPQSTRLLDASFLLGSASRDGSTLQQFENVHLQTSRSHTRTD